MSAPDLATVTLRPTRLERFGAVLGLLPTGGLIWAFAGSRISPGEWAVVALPLLPAAFCTWSVLFARVELRGPTLTVRNAIRIRRVTRPDVVTVVETAGWLARYRRIAGPGADHRPGPAAHRRALEPVGPAAVAVDGLPRPRLRTLRPRGSRPRYGPAGPERSGRSLNPRVRCGR